MYNVSERTYFLVYYIYAWAKSLVFQQHLRLVCRIFIANIMQFKKCSIMF